MQGARTASPGRSHSPTRPKTRTSSEPSAVSPTDAAAFAALERTIRQTFPGAIVAPYVVTAATDARHYEGLTNRVYRFLPLRLAARDLERLHGVDERIGRRDYVTSVQFYGRLLENLDKL